MLGHRSQCGIACLGLLDAAVWCSRCLSVNTTEIPSWQRYGFYHVAAGAEKLTILQCPTCLGDVRGILLANGWEMSPQNHEAIPKTG